MKGDKKVIEVLNQVLTNELTGINQYFIHSKMNENWGYTKLAAHMRAESIDEMKHADEIISRILYLEGVPNLQRLGKVNVGETIPEQFKWDKGLEVNAITDLKNGVNVCREANDHGTRELMERILISEEEHYDWIEAQEGLIENVGLQNYLAQQI